MRTTPLHQRFSIYSGTTHKIANVKIMQVDKNTEQRLKHFHFKIRVHLHYINSKHGFSTSLSHQLLDMST
jgi:hypothetical protein